MKLFQITFPNGRNLLAAGWYCGALVLWFGTAQLTLRAEHAHLWRPGGRAGW